MRTRDTKQEMLRSVPLFTECSRKQLAEVARLADEVHVEAGKVLMHEGEMARELLIVVSGRARAERGGQHLGDIGPGDAVGEIALIDHGPRTATVVATEPMELLSISGRMFDHVKEVVPGLTDAMLKAAIRRLRAADSKIAG